MNEPFVFCRREKAKGGILNWAPLSFGLLAVPCPDHPWAFCFWATRWEVERLC
ncbi:hypothetical protein Peur_054592 [Populus x canadensis]